MRLEEKIRVYHVALFKSWRNRLECEGHHRMSTAVVESRDSQSLDMATSPMCAFGLLTELVQVLILQSSRDIM